MFVNIIAKMFTIKTQSAASARLFNTQTPWTDNNSSLLFALCCARQSQALNTEYQGRGDTDRWTDGRMLSQVHYVPTLLIYA